MAYTETRAKLTVLSVSQNVIFIFILVKYTCKLHN